MAFFKKELKSKQNSYKLINYIKKTNKKFFKNHLGKINVLDIILIKK